ncbi:MAG: hypothetical protein ABI651_12380 [Verrucomicrobiota bacterium]
MLYRIDASDSKGYPFGYGNWLVNHSLRKRMVKCLVILVFSGLVALTSWPVQADLTNIDQIILNSDYSTVKLLAQDLYEALAPSQRDLIDRDMLVLQREAMPYVRPAEFAVDARPKPVVVVSEGFVDLVNNLSYAAANNLFEKGCLERYVCALAQETGNKKLTEFPALSQRDLWPLRMTNEQLTRFNQMAGTLVAIEMAHHYLGHYKKYKNQLTDKDGTPVPINSVITLGEWNDALTAGAVNALGCSLSVDGIKSFFECIDKMPHRPLWTAYFLLPKVNVRKVNGQLTRLEKAYFAQRR